MPGKVTPCIQPVSALAHSFSISIAPDAVNILVRVGPYSTWEVTRSVRIR